MVQRHCGEGGGPAQQVSTRSQKHQKGEAGKIIPIDQKSNSGRKGRNQNVIFKTPEGNIGLLNAPRQIDILKNELVEKKRAYKQALKAWEREKAKDRAYTLPSSTSTETEN